MTLGFEGLSERCKLTSLYNTEHDDLYCDLAPFTSILFTYLLTYRRDEHVELQVLNRYAVWCSFTLWRRTAVMRARASESASGRWGITVTGRRLICGCTVLTAVTSTTTVNSRLCWRTTLMETASHVCSMLTVERWHLERTGRWPSHLSFTVFIWTYAVKIQI